MKSLVIGLTLCLGLTAVRGETNGQLENNLVSWQWHLANGKIQFSRLADKVEGTSLTCTGECFRVILADGAILKASDFELQGLPQTIPLIAEPGASTAARHFPGSQLVVKLSVPKQHLSAAWKVKLREGSSYVRQELTLHAEDQDVFVKEIILFDQAIKGAKTVGKVDGSPVVADTFFVGYEHPMAHNTVSAADRVQCSYVRNAILKSGETLSQSLVIGTVPRGQLRRGFLSYVERERAHPYRPFLYYDAWFD